jgi:hypothetical protein
MRLARPRLAVTIAITALVISTSEAAGPARPPAATSPGAPASSFIVHRQLDAAVSQVDRDGGVIRLKTDAGRLTLQAPAGTMGLLRKGDSVILDVAVVRHPDPDRIPRDKVADRPLLVRRLPAEVSAVQRSVGVVALKTSAGRLNVTLPRAAVDSVRTGDRLSVELTLLRDSAVAAMPRGEGGERRAGLAAFLLRLWQAARSRQ